MYVITEWFERHEVNVKGHPAKEGDALRVWPLRYIRSKVHGRRMSAGFARMQGVAGDRAYEVFGVFQKLLEIVGSEKGDRRGGVLRNHRGEVATAKALAFDLRIPIEQIEYVIGVLTHSDVGWLETVEDELSGQSGNRPENPGVVRELLKRPDNAGNQAGNADCPDNRGNRPENPGALYKYKSKRSRRVSVSTKEVEGEAEESSTSLARTSSSTSVRHLNQSARLDFANKLRETLNPKNKSDLTALWHIQQWADRLGNAAEVYDKLLEIAKDSKNGTNPLAVFFSRVDKELGYRTRVEADKRRQ